MERARTLLDTIDARDAGLLLAGFLLGALLALALGAVPVTPDGTDADPLAGAQVRIQGTVERVDPGRDRLVLNATDGSGTVALAIGEEAVPYECRSGDALFSCIGRRSWSWIDPGATACVEVVLPEEGVPVVRRAYVGAGCSAGVEAPRRA